MKQLVIGGMIALGITFMVVSCFTYSMEREDKDKVLELIENVGYVAIAVIICMMIMVLSLVVALYFIEIILSRSTNKKRTPTIKKYADHISLNNYIIRSVSLWKTCY